MLALMLELIDWFAEVMFSWFILQFDMIKAYLGFGSKFNETF